MGVSVTHEPTGTPPGSLEALPTPPVGSESPSPITPPTPSPTPGPTDPAYVKLLEGSLRESNRRLQEIENKLAAVAAPAPPPPPSPDDQRREFYDNPLEANRKLIREELAESLKEIKDVARMFRGQSRTDELVTQFKADSRFSGQWDAAVEQYVREQSAQIPPDRLNEQSFAFLVVSAIGLKTTGMLHSFTNQPAPAPTPPAPAPVPVPSPSPTPAPMPTPPHMRPSPPAGPNGERPDPTKPSRPLSENELRLLREYNSGKSKEKQMNEAQFLQWQSMPAADVAFSDLGQPKK